MKSEIDKICASHEKSIREDLANESNKKLAEELKKLNMKASEIDELKKLKRMEEWSFSDTSSISVNVADEPFPGKSWAFRLERYTYFSHVQVENPSKNG